MEARLNLFAANMISVGHRTNSNALKWSHTMKRLYATMVIFLLSSGLALAQGTRGGTGPSTGSSTTNPANPSMALPPTVGLAPGVNPNNSKDLTNRSNPQNLTRPGGSNAQDLRR
jgi:hypothetical protein